MPDEPEKPESQHKPIDSAGTNTGDSQRDITKPVAADSEKLVVESQSASKQHEGVISKPKSTIAAGLPSISIVREHKVPELTPAQKRLAERATELRLKQPKLPLASLCMDGLPWEEVEGKSQGVFPSALNLTDQELAERLRDIGTFWYSKQRVLEFVDDKGQHHATRDTQSNIDALRQAGFKQSYFRETSSTNRTLSGEAKGQLTTILFTPENENERLQWAVRDANVNEFNYALAHGADPTASGRHNLSLISDALECPSSPERDGIIRQLLAKGALLYDKRETNVVSKALWSRCANLDVIPDLLKAGANPFQRSVALGRIGGFPAFVSVNLNKETAREELKLVVDHMLKQPDLSKAEVLSLKAQYRLIDDVMAKGEFGFQTQTIRDKLGDVWIFADKFTEELGTRNGKLLYLPDGTVLDSNDRHIPKRVQDLLEPLTDAKRTPKLVQTLMAYDTRDLLDRQVHDLLREFTTHVALPQALLEYSKTTGQALDDKFLRKLSKHFDASDLASKLEPAVREVLLGGRSIDRIIGLTEAWHDPEVVFPDSLKPLRAFGEWYSLTGQKEHVVPNLPGITIHVLTTGEELVREGDNLKHCVGRGSYTTDCLDGKTHIFSIRKAGEETPLSTLEGKWTGKTFEIVQNQGVKNAHACEEAIAAGQWLKDQIESGDIVANRKVGETSESKKLSEKRKIPEILRDIGFEITQENINAAFEEYTKNAKRRAREYNTETGEFDIISRRTELIAGTKNVKTVGDDGKVQTKGISFKDMTADQWFAASGLKSIEQRSYKDRFAVASKPSEATRSQVSRQGTVAVNTPELPRDESMRLVNKQSKPSPARERLAQFFDKEFFTGGQRTGFSAAANTLGAKGGLEMILHPNEYLNDNVRYAAGTTLLGSSAIGLKADYDITQAAQRLKQARQVGNELDIALARWSLGKAQKLTSVTGATTTGLMLPLEAYQAGAAFRKGNYGEGSLHTAKTTSSGLLLGSIGYSTAANVTAKSARVAANTEKAIELASMAGKYTKIAKFLGPIGVGIAIGTEVVDIGVKSYQIASAIQEIEEIRHSVTEAEKRAFRPNANPEYVDSMKKAQDKKAYEIEDPKATEYKHLNLTGYGSLAPADMLSHIEAELKTLEQSKTELSMRFSDVRTVTADDFGNIISESPSERELVQTPEGRISLKMSNHGFGLGEMIMPSSYVKYDNAISNVETVDNRIRILHAAKEELIGNANGNVNGNPHLLSYSARYDGVRQARAAYVQAVREIEPRIAEFEASLAKSNSDVPKYLDSVNERRDQYDRLQLEDSQVYAEAKKQADHFRQEYAKNPKDRLMYGLMLVTQANLEVMLSKEIQSLLEYSQTPANVRITHVQTQQEAMESRNEMRRIQNLFSGHQPIRNETIPDEQLMVAAEITIDPNHYRWFKKDLADKGLSIATFKESEAEDGKKIYTIGFWKGHFQEYLVSQNPVGQKQDALTVALSSGKVVTFADARQPRAILPTAIEQRRINVVHTSTQ